MSRWRETLCGSVLKGASDTPQGQKITLGPKPEMLTCGGAFLPKAVLPSKLPCFKPTVVYLPKESNEILVGHLSDHRTQWMRYGGTQDVSVEDMELVTEALKNLDIKPIK